MDDRHHIHLQDLSDRSVAALADLLYLPPSQLERETGQPCPGWLAWQAAAVAASPSSSSSFNMPQDLRRPRGPLQRVRMAIVERHQRRRRSGGDDSGGGGGGSGGRDRGSPSTAVLCSSHAGLNPWLVRRVFLLLAAEVTARVRVVSSSSSAYRDDLVTDGVREMVRRLRGVSALWWRESGSEPGGGRCPARVTTRFCRVKSGCEACMLAVVGARGRVLADLRANMIGRTRRKAPRLLRLVEAWAGRLLRGSEDGDGDGDGDSDGRVGYGGGGFEKAWEEAREIGGQVLAIRRAGHERRAGRRKRRRGTRMARGGRRKRHETHEERLKPDDKYRTTDIIDNRPAGTKSTEQEPNTNTMTTPPISRQSYIARIQDWVARTTPPEHEHEHERAGGREPWGRQNNLFMAYRDRRVGYWEVLSSSYLAEHPTGRQHHPRDAYGGDDDDSRALLSREDSAVEYHSSWDDGRYYGEGDDGSSWTSCYVDCDQAEDKEEWQEEEEEEEEEEERPDELGTNTAETQYGACVPHPPRPPPPEGRYRVMGRRQQLLLQHQYPREIQWAAASPEARTPYENGSGTGDWPTSPGERVARLVSCSRGSDLHIDDRDVRSNAPPPTRRHEVQPRTTGEEKRMKKKLYTEAPVAPLGAWYDTDGQDTRWEGDDIGPGRNRCFVGGEGETGQRGDGTTITTTTATATVTGGRPSSSASYHTASEASTRWTYFCRRG